MHKSFPPDHRLELSVIRARRQERGVGNFAFCRSPESKIKSKRRIGGRRRRAGGFHLFME